MKIQFEIIFLLMDPCFRVREIESTAGRAFLHKDLASHSQHRTLNVVVENKKVTLWRIILLFTRSPIDCDINFALEHLLFRNAQKIFVVAQNPT